MKLADALVKRTKEKYGYSLIEQDNPYKLRDVFRNEVGAKILMEAFIKASGEKMTYRISESDTSFTSNRDILICINVASVCVSGGARVMDFFSRERAQKFIDSMNSTENWNVELYLPYYNAYNYFEITENDTWVNIGQLCGMLEKLKVDLKRLAFDSRGMLHGAEFGI